jgi:hypothetical protein
MSLKRAIVFLLAVSAAKADVTLRYKSEIKPNPGLPAQMVEAMSKGVNASMPPETVLQIKGDKGYSTVGPFRSIIDMKSKQVTALDPEHQRYGTSSVQEFTDAAGKVLSDMPDGARAAMAAMKVTSDSRTTGRTTTILGIEAEEREATMSIEGPPVPNMPPGPMVKMVMQFWTAKAGQEERNPALKELLERRLSQYETMNPAAMLQNLFRAMPGMGEGMAKFMEDMRASNTVMLRTSASIWLPSVIEMMKQMPADRNPFGGNFDAAAPIFEMRNEASEISADPVPDSVFQIPAGYQAAPIAEIVKGMMDKLKPNQPQQ